MGKPIVRDFTQGKGILKFFPYEGAAYHVWRYGKQG